MNKSLFFYMRFFAPDLHSKSKCFEGFCHFFCMKFSWRYRFETLIKISSVEKFWGELHFFQIDIFPVQFSSVIGEGLFYRSIWVGPRKSKKSVVRVIEKSFFLHEVFSTRFKWRNKVFWRFLSLFWHESFIAISFRNTHKNIELGKFWGELHFF